MSREKLQELLSAYFNNTINPVDCAELLKFLDEADPEHILSAIDVMPEHYKSGPIFNEIQSKAVFSRILSDQRMVKNNIISPKKPTTILKLSRESWFRYAAVLFVIISLGIFIFNQQNTHEKTISRASLKLTNQAIDSTKATLTIAGKDVVLLNDTKGGVMTISGNTAVNRTKDGKLAYSTLGNENERRNSIVYNTLSVPRGGEYQIVLQDGTKVWLNSASSLSFPSEFSGNERKVTLTGEAYFEVAKNKKMPFRVNANGTSVQVLGTHFNISAYKDDEIVKTTLLEGSVSVANKDKQVILKPNQQAIGGISNGSIIVKEANTEEVMAWKNGYFVFEDVDIRTIMKDLVRWYNIEVSYSGKTTSLKFGGTFSRSKDITELLNYLETLGDVHFKKEGRRVIVMP